MAHPSDRRTTLAEILPLGRDVALEATAAVTTAAIAEPDLDADDTAKPIGTLAKVSYAASDFDTA